MEELKAFMKEVFCKAILFLIISVSAFSGQYKDALVNRMSDLRRSVFATVNEGNDFERKEALRKMEKEWDKELNIVYQKIMKTVNPVTRNKLRNAQRAWIKYRDSEIENSYYINNPDGGSMGVLFSLYTAAKLTEERTVYLVAKVDGVTVEHNYVEWNDSYFYPIETGFIIKPQKNVVYSFMGIVPEGIPEARLIISYKGEEKVVMIDWALETGENGENLDYYDVYF